MAEAAAGREEELVRGVSRDSVDTIAFCNWVQGNRHSPAVYEACVRQGIAGVKELVRIAGPTDASHPHDGGVTDPGRTHAECDNRLSAATDFNEASLEQMLMEMRKPGMTLQPGSACFVPQGQWDEAFKTDAEMNRRMRDASDAQRRHAGMAPLRPLLGLSKALKAAAMPIELVIGDWAPDYLTASDVQGSRWIGVERQFEAGAAVQVAAKAADVISEDQEDNQPDQRRTEAARQRLLEYAELAAAAARGEKTGVCQSAPPANAHVRIEALERERDAYREAVIRMQAEAADLREKLAASEAGITQSLGAWRCIWWPLEIAVSAFEGSEGQHTFADWWLRQMKAWLTPKDAGAQSVASGAQQQNPTPAAEPQQPAAKPFPARALRFGVVGG